MSDVNWKKLQNGSDIRGVALEGVPNETVNLTSEVVATIGKAFVSWLGQKQEKSTSTLTIAVGRDSRLSGPALMQSVITGMTSLPGCPGGSSTGRRRQRDPPAP